MFKVSNFHECRCNSGRAQQKSPTAGESWLEDKLCELVITIMASKRVERFSELPQTRKEFKSQLAQRRTKMGERSLNAERITLQDPVNQAPGLTALKNDSSHSYWLKQVFYCSP